MNRIVIILGPTAGGKSDLAIGLAQAFGGEIVSADSMQVYRHLDAGTAKPSVEQRFAVMHHLIDIVEPTEPWTVADWLDAAERAIADIQQRGRLPIVVGGTNLYIKALLEGMFAAPGADAAFRRSLDDVASADLHSRLSQVDPVAAQRIHPNDRKRLIRALEVHHLTGTGISQWQTQWAQSDEGGEDKREGGYRHNAILVGLRWPVEAINRRINARVKSMFDPPGDVEDLVSETRRLREAGLLGPQASEALGTKQVLAHLAGRCTLEEAVEQVKIETRRYAKAQRTWLRRYRDVRWLDADQADSRKLLAEAMNWLSGPLGGGQDT